jgi:F-type H+-transporting ATPase subunit epsilon
MATFSFELVAPERVLFSGDVDAVILPASEGDMTVMPGHEPMMTALKTGFLIITDRPGSGRRVLVRGGFADVNQRGLTVLAERALPEEEITQHATFPSNSSRERVLFSATWMRWCSRVRGRHGP